MSAPQFPIAHAVRAQRRSAYAIVASLIVLAIGLTGLTTFVLLSRVALNRVTSDLEELCRTGAIDCSGNPGLPGAQGIPGTGIRGIQCLNGQFIFTLTNGTDRAVGDCVAEDGLKGDKGDKGDTGQTGKTGKQGLKGNKGDRGLTGPQGPAGPRGPKGNKGGKGDPGIGVPGPPGPAGPPGPPHPPGPPANPVTAVPSLTLIA